MTTHLAELACDILADEAEPVTTVSLLGPLHGVLSGPALLDAELNLDALFRAIEDVPAPDGRRVVSKSTASNGFSLWAVV